jgi:hypothetical protein
MLVRDVTNARKPVTNVGNEDSVGRQRALAPLFWIAARIPPEAVPLGVEERPTHRRSQIDPISDIASQISIRVAGNQTVEA